MPTLYSGPGKVYINNIALQPEGVNGPVKIQINEETSDIAAAMFGRVGEILVDKTAEFTVKPFDNWGNIPTLFPPRIGVTSAGGTAALQIGSRPHANAVGPGTHCKIWTPDGRLYDMVLAAVWQHPSLHLGTEVGLFGEAKIMGIHDPAKTMGQASALMDITESGAADPGGQMTMSDFARGAWTGSWGSVTGFTGIEAEDEWTIETEAQYSRLKVQGRTVGTKVDSVNFMAKVRPYGPTHTQILGIVGAHTHGQRLGQHNLVLSGPLSKTITLYNCEVRGAGFEFGGTKLGTGEIGFVTEMRFTAGVAQPLMAFSS